MHLEGYNSYYGTGSDCLFVIDPYTGKRRKARLGDVAGFSRVVDALANIDFNLGMSVAHDAPAPVADVYQFYEMVTNTRKPIVYAAYSPLGLRWVVEMCEAIAGGADALRRNPFAHLYGSPISPLQFGRDDTQNMLYSASKGLPYVLGPSAIAGGTAPVTLAGAMVQMNAEMLAGLVMYELEREGAPFIMVCGSPLPMDMRTGIASYGSPETWLFQSGMAELQRYQGLPTFGLAGCTDAKVFDEQASLEGAVSLLIAALTGVNMIHDVGYLEYAKTSSFELLAVMDEMAGEIKHILRGIDVTAETIALDVIDEVGPGGEYVTTDHTLRYFREAWVPNLVGDRDPFETWAQRGGSRLRQRASEHVKQILSDHVPEPLPGAVQAEICRLREAASHQLT
jgi:trimethylamine--corrinoid protein Co-methyltransferase